MAGLHWHIVVAGRIMLRRWAIIIGVAGLGLLLYGCTKCGPIWDDWMQPSNSCRSDHL